MKKERLDKLLVQRGLAPTRQRAQALILGGVVLVNDRPSTKAGTAIPEDAELRLKGNPIPYVSRGGLKLEGALKAFPIPLEGRVAMDVGISTGGFTDLLLQRGVARVIGLDVGKGQIDWKLRNDPRLTLFEHTTARYFDPALLDEIPDLVVIDVSFISLTLILPVVWLCVAPGGDVFPMVKPQFELSREDIGKHGVVRNPEKHVEAVQRVRRCALELGFEILGEEQSPVPGPKGNIEFFLHLKRPEESAD